MNDAGDIYLHRVAVGHEHDKPGHNIQIVYYMQEEENVDRSNLIDKRVFKPTIGNATKQLRM